MYMYIYIYIRIYVCIFFCIHRYLASILTYIRLSCLDEEGGQDAAGAAGPSLPGKARSNALNPKPLTLNRHAEEPLYIYTYVYTYMYIFCIHRYLASILN